MMTLPTRGGRWLTLLIKCLGDTKEMRKKDDNKKMRRGGGKRKVSTLGEQMKRLSLIHILFISAKKATIFQGKNRGRTKIYPNDTSVVTNFKYLICVVATYKYVEIYFRIIQICGTLNGILNK